MGRLKLLILEYLPKRGMSSLIGNISRVRNRYFQRLLIKMFIKKYQVELSDISRSVEEYATLAEFFTRELKEGAREIAKNRIVSPVDGVLTDCGRISDGLFYCKGESLSMMELINDSGFMSEIKDGYFSIHYLSPKDYHWIHSPVEGEIYQITRLPGTLYPVFEEMLCRKRNILCINERLNVFIRSGELRVCVSMIAAMGVGNIILNNKFKVYEDVEQPISSPVQIAKGEKLAVFALGSTVVLAFNKVEPSENLVGKHLPVGYGISRV